MTQNGTRRALDVDEALARADVIEELDDNGEATGRRTVHTLRQAKNGMLLGADWDLEELRAHMARWRVEKAGPAARATGHGLVVLEEGRGPLFIATRRNEARR